MQDSQLRYLTVQDVLWINLQVTNDVQPFDYALLEEATFAQYAYGESLNLIEQAVGFACSVCDKAPFHHGNAAAAFVSLVGMLALNGKNFNLLDNEASTWAITQFQKPTISAAELIKVVGDAKPPHNMATQLVVSGVIERFPITITSLLESEG